MRFVPFFTFLAMTSAAGVAHADWERGVMPEGGTAYTVQQRELRLDLVGRSAFGITSRTELSTYVLLDAILFPNLELKVRVFENDDAAWAISGGVGAGLY